MQLKPNQLRLLSDDILRLLSDRLEAALFWLLHEALLEGIIPFPEKLLSNKHSETENNSIGEKKRVSLVASSMSEKETLELETKPSLNYWNEINVKGGGD